MCFQPKLSVDCHHNPPFQGVEVCADEVVDQLLRGGLHLAAALQHHANHQVLDQLDQEDGGQGEETLGQVQRSRGSRDPAPRHHALHCQEVCTSQSMKVGSHRDEILTNAKCYFAPPSWILISPPYKNLVYKFIVGLSCMAFTCKRECGFATWHVPRFLPSMHFYILGDTKKPPGKLFLFMRFRWKKNHIFHAEPAGKFNVAPPPPCVTWMAAHIYPATPMFCSLQLLT